MFNQLKHYVQRICSHYKVKRSINKATLDVLNQAESWVDDREIFISFVMGESQLKKTKKEFDEFILSYTVPFARAIYHDYYPKEEKENYYEIVIITMMIQNNLNKHPAYKKLITIFD